MLSLPRTTKAMRRICVNPSHCLIFHQSKHSYLSRPLDICASDRYNNAGCRVTLLCWVVQIPVQPGGGGLIPPPGACNLLFLHPYSTAWGLIRQEPNKYISFKSLRLFPLTFVGWLGVYFLPFYRHKTFSQLAIHKQKKFSNPPLCLSFFPIATYNSELY